LSDAGDLTDLAKAINDVQGKTGVTATLSDDKSQILLENSEGYDISIANVGVSGLTMQGVQAVSDRAVGASAFDSGAGAVATVAAGTGESTVAGTVTFDSSKSYSVTASDASLGAAGVATVSSRITDADFATETAKLSKAQVLQQASMAMLAQANQQPQQVLSLLR